MSSKLSARLLDIVNALPLKNGLRILEIGCGPGAAAREMAGRIGNGHVLGIDRSAKAISQAISGSAQEIKAGSLSFRIAKVEDFELEPGEAKFDIAIAIRVGALDGRHPEIEKKALTKIANALKKGGVLYIDGGNPVKILPIDAFRNSP